MQHRTQGYPVGNKATLPRPIRFMAALLAFLALGLLAACSSADSGQTDSGDGQDQAATETETAESSAAAEPTTTAPLDVASDDEPTTEATEAAADPEPSEPPWAAAQFDLQTIVEVDQPLDLGARPGTNELWLLEREGRVVRLDGQQTSVELDISGSVTTAGEGGLLGFDFSNDGQLLYLSFTDNSGANVIDEYQMDQSSIVVGTKRTLLRVEQPFSNHNGGQIAFGPDGMLYIGIGDGGQGGDPLGSGQDTSTLLGSILRIDPANPSDGLPYGIPADNPFVDSDDARPETWIYGVRNPWRFAFDDQTGDLWIGDVGQNQLEEIDYLPSVEGQAPGGGANLGWNVLEGDQFFDGSELPPNNVDPLWTYSHDNGRCSITGGYVYRGQQIESLQGAYLYADLCSGELFGLRRLTDGRLLDAPVSLNRDLGQVVSFGQGPDLELYILEADGRVSRLQQG